MSDPAAIIAEVTGGVIGLAGVGELVRRYVVKPLQRVQDTLEDVTGRPARVVNGFTVQERVPGIREEIAKLGDTAAALDRGQAHLVQAVDIMKHDMGAMGGRVSRIEAQFENNGGSSFKDKLDQVHEVVVVSPPGQQAN